MRCSTLAILIASSAGFGWSSAAAQSSGSILATATVTDTQLEWRTQAAAVHFGRVALAQSVAGSNGAVRQEVGSATITMSAHARKEAVEGSFDPLVTITYW